MRTQAAELSQWRSHALAELDEQYALVESVLSNSVGESFSAAWERFTQLLHTDPEDRLRAAITILNLTAESFDLLNELFDRSILATALIRDVQAMGKALDFACSRAILALCTHQPDADLTLGDLSTLTSREIHELTMVTAPEQVVEIVQRYDATLLEASEGRMAIAFGDIDNASHITTIVPGVGSQWDHYAALAQDFHSDGATIMWFGYQPPHSLPAGIATHPAAVGGEHLHAFQNALRARTDAQLTVIGHSYGSVVAGYAASERTLAADTLILAGSPGVPPDLKTDGRIVAALTRADLISFTGTRQVALHGEDPALNPNYEQWRLSGGHSDYLSNPEFRERIKAPLPRTLWGEREPK